MMSTETTADTENTEEMANNSSSSNEQTVPRSRLSQVIKQRNALKEENERLQSELSSHAEMSNSFEELKVELETWKEKAALAETAHQDWVAVSTALSITDNDVIDLINMQYGKLPSEERPSKADWLQSLKDSPSEAPKLLRPFLPNGSAGTHQDASSSQPTKARSTPAPQTGSAPHAPPDDWKAAFENAKRMGVNSGDWSEYKRLKLEYMKTR